MQTLPVIAVVTRESRLEDLKQRWVTGSALKFRMQQAASHEKVRLLARAKKSRSVAKSKKLTADLELALAEAADALSDDDELRDENEVYQQTLATLMADLELGLPVKKVDRSYISNFDFQRCAAVVVCGQDGLVANVAKYVGDVPIIGVNPDPSRHDGVLLPFDVRHARSVLKRTLDGKSRTRAVTLAEVTTNDGQRMLAFNDFFLGCKTHTSARYTLELNLNTESQSSSGIIISTGAGSTGWMSSIFNMVEKLRQQLPSNRDKRSVGGKNDRDRLQPASLNWEDNRLIWAVREPYVSRHSSAGMVGGVLDSGEELVIGSQMTGNGVIFSDGVESDFIEFNSGSIAAFRVASQKAQLVTG